MVNQHFLVRLFRRFALSWLILLSSTLFGCASTAGTAENKASSTVQPAIPEDVTGIQIVSLRTTAAGHIVDLRYRVTDPAKAAPVFDRRNKAYLIDQATGTKLPVPRTAKVGPLRQTNFKADTTRVYFILFSNPGGIVKSGSAVTIEVGDWRMENLVVQ